MIHARVSSTDQAQVIDPLSEDSKDYRKYYEGIWKEIYEKSEADVMCVDPEYGPSPYAILDPKNHKYIVDIEEVISKSIDNLKKILC
jgi:hypothetical protein